MWDCLPPDVAISILRERHLAIRRERAAQTVQRAWRGYRARVLCGRFRALRHLRPFRQFNPSLPAFLRRAKL